MTQKRSLKNEHLAPERSEDDTLEASLRPKRLADFVGQQQARENLSIFIDAAKTRGEALDHVLFHGPPGLGKTTLAQIVARELGVNFRSTSGPVLAKAGDLAAILTNLERGARVLGFALTQDGAREIAARSRGTSRIAGRLLKRVRDFAAVAGQANVDAKIADAALTRLEVDGRGLDAFDRRYLSLIAETFAGGPVGIETIAAALSEARDAIEEIVEPYLLQQGLLQRTPRGRMVTGAAYAQLGLEAPARDPGQLGLFVQEGDDGR